MKRHLNTLFLTRPETSLYKDGEAIGVRIPGEMPKRFPIHNIGNIVCFGDISCSPSLMDHCVKNKTSISFLSVYGRFRARVTGPVSGNVLLRKEQYRWSDDQDKSAAVAQNILVGKIVNSRTSLIRSRREYPEFDKDGKISVVIDQLASFGRELRVSHDLDTYRGIEGSAAQAYFSVFDLLIRKNKQDFFFSTRSKHPPLDRVNALMSFAYTMLMNDVRSALEMVGLDPSVGFLHRDRPGRASLALDMMEEFRSFFADRLVLSLINKQMITEKHFEVIHSGAVHLNDKGRKIFLSSYQDRKQTELYHPYLEEKTTLGLLFYIQALLLARFIRGDIDGYPSFFWR